MTALWDVIFPGHGPLPVQGGIVAVPCKQAAPSASTPFSAGGGPLPVQGQGALHGAPHLPTGPGQAAPQHPGGGHLRPHRGRPAEGSQGARGRCAAGGLLEVGGSKATCRKHLSCCKELLCARDAPIGGTLQRAQIVPQTAVRQMGCFGESCLTVTSRGAVWNAAYGGHIASPCRCYCSIEQPPQDRRQCTATA